MKTLMVLMTLAATPAAHASNVYLCESKNVRAIFSSGEQDLTMQLSDLSLKGKACKSGKIDAAHEEGFSYDLSALCSGQKVKLSIRTGGEYPYQGKVQIKANGRISAENITCQDF